MDPSTQAAGRAAPLSRARSAALVGAVLVAGAMSMGLEMLGSRLLAPDFGQSLYTWGALISVVLVALATGYSAGGLLSRRRAGLGLVGALLLAGGAWMALLPWIASPVTEHLSDLGDRAGALAASAVLFAVPVAAFAGVGPTCIGLKVTDAREAGLWAGLLSALSTAGSVAGTLGTSFYLIETWSVRGSLLAGGVLTMAVGAALTLAERLGGARAAGEPAP
jgi:hypothetical protein